jgi:hypothetical protein
VPHGEILHAIRQILAVERVLQRKIDDRDASVVDALHPSVDRRHWQYLTISMVQGALLSAQTRDPEAAEGAHFNGAPHFR